MYVSWIKRCVNIKMKFNTLEKVLPHCILGCEWGIFYYLVSLSIALKHLTNLFRLWSGFISTLWVMYGNSKPYHLLQLVVLLIIAPTLLCCSCSKERWKKLQAVTVIPLVRNSRIYNSLQIIFWVIITQRLSNIVLSCNKIQGRRKNCKLLL